MDASNQVPVNQRMVEVQQKIQQVQQQIQHAQMQGPLQAPPPVSRPGVQHGQMDHHQQLQQQQQQQNMIHRQQQQRQQMGMQNMSGNMAGFTRSPPGRSISMPVQRMNNSQVTPFSNSFVLQQQQQQQNALQAMSQSLNSVHSDHGGQQQHPQQQQFMMDMSSRPMMDMSTQPVMDMSSRSMPTETNGDPAVHLAMMQNSFPMRNNSLPRSGGGESFQSGSFDLAMMAQSYAASNQQGGVGGQQGASNVNEAMEKLCESMRRSAMSRTLVKQLSGRSINRTPSGRSIQRTNSGRRPLVRANSGRQISRANSGKGLQRPGTGEIQPVRRLAQDPKHRMTPSRGVFRNHSTTAVAGVHELAAMQQRQQQQQSLGHSSLHTMDSSFHSLNDRGIQEF